MRLDLRSDDVPRPRSALAASSLAFCLVLLDTSLVNVALPTIRRLMFGGVAVFVLGSALAVRQTTRAR
jgi:hypothetical protein